MSSESLTDVEGLRRRAREHMESGAVTAGYKADRKAVIAMLNTALATELVCVLRYMRHFHMAKGLTSAAISQEFLEHANDEQVHVGQIAQRITQLDGEPDFNPDGLSRRSHSEYKEGGDLVDMLREDLVAERIAVESYGEIIRYLGNDDPTTRRLIEEILAKEEEHANDLADLVSRLGAVQNGESASAKRER